MYCNGVLDDKEGGVYTASVKQDAAHYSLDSIDFYLETVGDSSGESWPWASLPYLFGAIKYGECCGLGGVSCLYFLKYFFNITWHGYV